MSDENEHLQIELPNDIAPEERERGILTDVDRQFLLGVKDYKTRQQNSERRGIIRDRIVNAIRDLSYFSKLDEDYRQRVFSAVENETGRGELRESVAALIQFLYLGIDADLEWFEETIAHGISNAERELQNDGTYYPGSSVDAGVNVDIEVTRGYDVDEIEERLRAGQDHTLTPAEVGVLVREGRIDDEDIWDLSGGKGGIPSDSETRTLRIPDGKWIDETREEEG